MFLVLTFKIFQNEAQFKIVNFDTFDGIFNFR